jgi:hypothetical protein
MLNWCHRSTRRTAVTIDRPTVTPEQARQQLAEIQARSLSLPRDRRIHAIGTAVFGVTSAILLVTRNVVTGTGAVGLAVVALVVLVGEGVWVERAARTVPRRARFWSRLGIGASFVLGLGLVLPWLNLQAQTSPNTWPMVAAAAVVVAAPALTAAAAIARARR